MDPTKLVFILLSLDRTFQALTKGKTSMPNSELALFAPNKSVGGRKNSHTAKHPLIRCTIEGQSPRTHAICSTA